MGKKRKFKIGQRFLIGGHGIVEIIGTDTQEHHGISTEVYLIKNDPKLTFSTNLERSVPVSQAKRIFIDLPGKGAFKKIIEIVHQPPQFFDLPTYRIAPTFEHNLTFGKISTIAEVYRDTVSADQSKWERNEIPHTYKVLKDEAALALLVCYQEVFGVDREAAEQAIFPNTLIAPKYTPQTSKQAYVQPPSFTPTVKKIHAPIALPEEFKNAAAYETVMAMPLNIVFSTAARSNGSIVQIQHMIQTNSGLKTLLDLWEEIQNPDWEQTAMTSYDLDAIAAEGVKKTVIAKAISFSESFSKQLT